MHKPESAQKNETYEILLDFERQTDYPIPARRPDRVLINKKKKTYVMNFAIQADNRVKIKEGQRLIFQNMITILAFYRKLTYINILNNVNRQE